MASLIDQKNFFHFPSKFSLSLAKGKFRGKMKKLEKYFLGNVFYSLMSCPDLIGYSVKTIRNNRRLEIA